MDHSQELRKTNSLQHRNEFLQNVKQATEEDMSFIRLVVRSRGELIKDLDEKAAQAAVYLMIEQMAKAYVTSGQDLAEEVHDECVMMVMDEFSNLSIKDIKSAYRMFATGKLDAPDAKTYGKYTAQHLGALLKAFSDRKRKVNIQINHQLNADQHQAEQQEKAKVSRQNFEDNFDQYLQHQAVRS